ncbi:methionyl-tRNA formyltransferase [Rhodobacteraceae bacterium]|nr:methionyl-tRNA formyltransferase [Paracoccaceae bacterium]
MKLIFMGTPDFSVPPLDALVDAGLEVTAVYTQPPRPAGRGKKDRPTAVHARASALGLSVHTPTNLKSDEARATFQSHQADIAVVVAYGLILPQTILDGPTQGCLNIHASLLPRWRGAAPIHRAIMAGDSETGVAIMQMEAGLDTGPVLMTQTLAIESIDTTGTLHDKLSTLGADLITKTLTDLPNLTPSPQPEDGITYAHKIDKTEARIDWSKPATEISRQIRGLSPFPGAWCDIDGERVKFLNAVTTLGTAAPGTHLGGFKIACGENAVEITKAQRPGKRPMTAEDFLRGAKLPAKLH